MPRVWVPSLLRDLTGGREVVTVGGSRVGEVPIVPPMAAVANAIARATGSRLRNLPMSPPRLRAAIDAEELPRAAE